MDVAAGLKMPVIWTLTLQQWVPQVYHSILSTPTSPLCVYDFSLLMFTTSLLFVLEIIWIWSLLFSLSESSYKKADNTFQWPPTIPAGWFSSVTSSADWVIILRSLLVSCMPGALQSSLDLPWHLTLDTCCRYDRRRTVQSAAERWYICTLKLQLSRFMQILQYFPSIRMFCFLLPLGSVHSSLQ